ncbi:MAG: UbiX family flavin prenyltransferase [Burkholderiaceae bacterium]|nr:UbiX family flavin prenyltransferase [Burkholderiaceae bacterium]
MNTETSNPAATAGKNIVVAITGATGTLYGVRILEQLARQPEWTSHVVLSEAGGLNAWHEQNLRRKDIESLADVVHHHRNIGASIASGSFLTEGMIVAPCSMKTLAAIALGYSDNLVSRAADVALKERRRVVLVVREAPLNLAHLRNMVAVTEMGGIIFPPVPAFYAGVQSVDDIVNHTVGRVLDLFGIRTGEVKRWTGLTGGREE